MFLKIFTSTATQYSTCMYTFQIIYTHVQCILHVCSTYVLMYIVYYIFMYIVYYVLMYIVYYILMYIVYYILMYIVYYIFMYIVYYTSRLLFIKFGILVMQCIERCVLHVTVTRLWALLMILTNGLPLHVVDNTL